MQTIGQRLKAEREERRLTLEKVFEATRIRIQYLQALEADDLSVMPSPVQARGYLRNYAEYLGFEVDKLLAEMRLLEEQQPSGRVIGPADEFSPDSPAEKKQPETPSLTPDVDIADAREENAVLVEQPASSLSVTVPIKPKPARRKKADSQPPPASTEPTTRRSSRKKSEPEISLIESRDEKIEEIHAPMELAPQPEPAMDAPVASVESIPPTEPVQEGSAGLEQGPSEPKDVSDTLWQTWLNRLGSVLSARGRRQTLVPKEPLLPQEEVTVNAPEPEAAIEVTSPEAPLQNSNEILKEIGRELRERRELLSLHFDEVERNTHVKAHYLDALERGALDELSSTVQTRGMLSNYATFLDLDVDALLLRFADALQARHRERNPQKPARKAGQPIIASLPPARTFIAGDMVFGVGMVILLVGFAIWGVSRVLLIQSQREVKPTAISISDVLLTAPATSASAATPTFVQVESFPGEATVTVEIPTQNANAQVQLNLVAVERTYMRVVVDGKVAFDGRVVPGNAYPFEAENQIEVLVGNAAAIRTVYNGRDLGLMGTFGQVVNNIYLETEIITPTIMPTTTQTITLTPTKTAPPTSTLRSTNTPVSSATSSP
jgi:cytoskeletal protein RodZ